MLTKSEKKQPRDPADASRQARILAAAGDVFRERGFDAATTLDIAARARVSKRDLYRLFESKHGILEALIRAHSTELTIPSDLADPVDFPNMLEILREFGAAFLVGYLDERKIALYRIAIAEAPRSTSLGAILLVAGAGPVIESSKVFMSNAAARGIVAPEDTGLLMQAFFDVLIGPWHLRRLTGTHAMPNEAEIAQQADQAVEVVRRIALAPHQT